MVIARSSADLKAAYDFVVVGGGSAGVVVARRLAEAGDATVLLIEAGPSDRDVAEIHDPTRWPSLDRSSHDWGHDLAPTGHVNGRTIGTPQGRVLGGSSSINSMLWQRGHPADYDAWAEAGAVGWSFADCLPFFKRTEDWEDGETALRGAGGPMRIARPRDPHPLAWAMIEAAAELGIPVIDDANGASNEGAALANLNLADGRRWSVARGYLDPVEHLDTLTILSGSLALRLGFSGPRCTSVHHLVDGRIRETAATCEVILALGAIGTPRILMLSGIGNPATLGGLGIDTVAAQPGVGANLQDHPLIRAVNFFAHAPLGPLRDNGGGAVINWKSRPALAKPDLHATCIQGRSAVPELAAGHDLSGHVFAIAVGLMGSKSVGAMRLLDTSPTGRLEIQPNLLSHPEDLAALVTAIDFVMDLVATSAFAHLFAGYAAPRRRLSKSETVDFIRMACTTFSHLCGTCRMGEDDAAVVDSKLKLRGVDGLRVADASVIPLIPSCSTLAPVLMIAERAAAFIRAAH